MQRFKSHKIVTAARIIEVGTSSTGHLGYLLLQGHSTAVPMPMQWWTKHNPERGGYLVQYEDGYSSYSPAKAFEEGYHLIEGDDAAPHPVWPLRTSCEPYALEQSVPLPLPKPPTEIARVTGVRSEQFREAIALHGWVTMYEVRYDRARPPEVFRSTDPKLGGRVPEVGDRLMRAEDGVESIEPPAAPELPTRVTGPALEAMFESVTYEIRADGRTTVCEITFKNGFTLRGESSAACVENFRRELGEEKALQDAMDKAWGYAGFMLREDRYRAGLK
jgi:hypothetical protein